MYLYLTSYTALSNFTFSRTLQTGEGDILKGFIYFSCLIVLARTSNTLLNKSGESALFLILEEKLSALHHWVLCSPWACHIWPLLCWVTFPVYPLCWHNPAFIINGCWIFSNAFSASIEMIIWFLYFILLMWCITLIDLQVLNHPCIPGINPTWSWCMILFMYCWFQFVNILVRSFACTFFRDIPVIFFSCVVLVWFWYQDNVTLIKWVWKCSLLFYFLEEITFLSLTTLSLISPKPAFPTIC